MIELWNINVVESGYSILKNINLVIREQRIGIIGANGSGKSTLTKLIKGLIKLSDAHIFLT